MENITKFNIRRRNLFGKMSDTALSGRNELGIYMKITKISDVSKGTDVLEGTIRWEGGGGRVRGRVDRRCSPFALVCNSDLAQEGNRSLECCTKYFPKY